MSTPSTPPTKTILIGLSGPSSSGKTTLARHLRTIFTISPDISLSIIHLDDFYKTDTQIPVKTFHSSKHGTRTLQDWDCVESLDLDLLEETLTHVSRTGTLPDDLVSKEDQNSVGESGVSADEINEIHSDVRQWFDHATSTSTSASPSSDPTSTRIKIWILDGFLLYPDPSLASSTSPSPKRSPSETHLLTHLRSLLQPLLDLKLFLPCSKSQTISRRTARTGYVTLEGFWTDPPGYVEDVVWVNYVRDHGWMFRKGTLKDREGDDGDQIDGVDETEFDVEKVRGEGIHIAPGRGRMEMRELIKWATKQIKVVVQREL